MNVHVAPFSLHFACSDGCIGSRRCVFRTRSMSVMRLFRVLLLCLGALGSGLALAQAVSFTSAGAYSYTVPSGVTRLRVEVGGGGGGGGGREGSNNGSRGGAGHVLWTILNVSPGQVVSGVVAGGGGAGQGPVTGTGGGTAGSGAASGGAGGNAGGSGSSGSGGGGGGASSVLLAGNLVMVAAGGSGGGGAGSVGSSVQGMPASVLTLAATCSVSPGSAGGTSSSDGGGGGGGGGAGFAAGAGGPWHADSVNATTPATEGTSCALTTPSLFAVALRSGQGLNFGTTSSTLPPTAGGSGYVILQPDNYSSVFSPGAYSYTVPNGVYRLAYLVDGAGGGHGGYDLSIPGGSGSGGLQAYGVLNVQPGQVVSGVVGSKGSAGTSDVTGAGAGAGGSGAANGGSGGNAGSTGASGGGGGGGGASSMALGGNLVLLAAGGPGGQGGATASDPQRSNPPSSITGASSCLPTNGQAGAAMAGDGGGGGGGGGGNSAAAAGGTGHADGTYSGAAASAGSSCYVNNVGATGIFMAAPTAASNWNGTGMAVLGPAPSADLVVSKSDARTSVQIGDVTTYTLTVSNLTGSAYEGAITGAILSDPAVSGLSKQAVACSSTPGQCVSPPTVAQLQAGTFALPALNPGDTYELLVTVLVDNSARGTITNTASVSHLAGNSSYINGLGCTNPASGGLSRSYQYSAGVGTCTASDTNTVLTLQGSMTAPGHFTALNSDNYTFTVSNKSSAATSGQINIVIQLPAGLRANGGAAGTVVAGSTDGAAWSCVAQAATGSGQSLTCSSLSVIGGGAGSVFTLPVVPMASLTGSGVTSVAQVSGGNDPSMPLQTSLGACPNAAGCMSAGPTSVSASNAIAGGSSVAISAGPKIANGSDAYTLTATAKDADGNLTPSSATTFNFSAPGAGAALSAASCTTATSGGSAGTCSVTLTATTAGSYSVTATLGGTNVGGTNPVTGTFTAGSVTAAGSSVAISSGPKIANGSDAYTLTVAAKDANGNLNTSAATTFNFSAPGTGAALSAATCTTATTGGSAGSCSVTLTATNAGSYSVTATLGGTNVGGTNPVVGVFTAGSVTAAGSSMAISSGPKIANGSDAYTITVTAKDANGNLNISAATTFSFSAPGTGAALSAATCTTATTGGSAGTCSVTLTATVAGSYAITASLGGTAVGGSNPVTGVFTAGAATAGSSRVVISAGPKTANGTDAYTITASAYDALGNLNTTSVSTFSFSNPGAGASLSASSCSTTAGVCSVTLTATVAGSYAVAASLDGTAVGGSNPVTGVFVAGAATATASRVTISAGPKTANGSDAYTITATAWDANGNLVSGSINTFNFSAPGTGAGLSALSCSTTAGTCSVTLSATVAGSYAITASLGGTAVGGTNPVTGVFVAGAATAAASRISLSSGPLPANGSAAYTLSVTAYDAQGNLAAGSSTFTFSSPSAGAVLSASSCSTTAGTCSVTLSATVAGSYAITASLGGTALGGSNPVNAVFVAGVPVASASLLAIDLGPKTANGSDSYTLTITANDAQGNLSADSATTFSFDTPQPAGGAFLSAGTCTTATSGPQAGRCSLSLKATTAGSYSVQARLDGRLVGGSNPATAVFEAGSPSANASRVAISAGPRVANGLDSYTLTVSALDANGNLSTAGTSTFTFSAPSAGASLSASSCSTTAGTCSVTLSATVAGSYAITASLGGNPLGGGNPVTGVFVAGAPTAASARVALSAGPKLADGVDAYTLTASALDGNGNLNGASAITVSFSAPGAGASLSAGSCTTATSGAAAGTCTVSLTATTAGSYPVTASLAGTPLGGSNPVTAVFVPGPVSAAGSILSMDTSGPLTADGVAAYTLTVRAQDAWGNLNSSAAITFAFSDPGAGAVLSASTCSTATTGAAAGACSVSLRATLATVYSVSASLGGAAVGGNNPFNARFVAGEAVAATARASIDAGPKLANGIEAYTLTASATDAFGNLDSSRTYVFSFSPPGAGGALSASTCTTATSGAAAGTCSVSLSSTVAGAQAIRVSLGGQALGGTNPLVGTFVAGPVTPASARVSLSSGPRTANGSDAYTLTAQALDAYGNLNTGVSLSVSFSNPGAGASLSASSCTTSAGTCSVTLTATVAASYNITASLGGTALGGGNPLTALFVPGPVSAARSTLAIDAGPKTANGSDAYTLTVTALDAQGNPVSMGGQTFNFSVTGSGASLSASSCSSSGGQCSVTLRATVAGSYSVTASLAGTALGVGNPAQAVFVAGPATPGSSRISITPDGPKAANGFDSFGITVSALDAQGNLVTGTASTFTFSNPGPGAALSASSCSTLSGSCQVQITATVAGSYLVGASLGGTPVDGGHQVSASFQAGAVTAGVSKAVISAGPKIANGLDAYTVSAEAYDALGNRVTLNAVSFTFALEGAPNAATLGAASCVTPTTGAEAGRCGVSLVATRADSYRVQVRLDGEGLGNPVAHSPVTGVFVADNPSAASSRVSISAGPKTANGTDAYTITASAYDSQGNLNTSSATIFNFTAPGVGASLSASSCSTTAGVCSVTLTATVAGSYAVTASTGGVPVGGSNPVTGVFVAGLPAAANSRVSISTGPKLANGVDSYTITATAYDAQGNPNTGNATVFNFSAPAVGSSLSASSCSTVAGACSVTLTATVAGSYAITASTGGSALGGSNPVSAVFVAGSPTAGGSRVTLSAGPKTATSGAQAGSCSVTLKSTQAGWFTVISQVGGVPVGNPSGGQVAAQFVAGPAVAANSVITISPGARQADGLDTHTVTITARDAFDNVQGDVSTLFTFSPPAAGASLSATTCNTATTGADAGSCSVTLKASTPGTYTVSGSLGGQTAGNPVQGQFVASAGGAVTAVPTLSEWGCVGLALSLGLLGAVSRGHKRHRTSPARAQRTPR